MVPANTYILGLDLGQSQDYTAISIVQRVLPAHPDTRRPDFHIRHLERPALGTKYTMIVARIKELLATPPLTAATPLAIDKTGVGAAVFDMFTGAGLRPFAVTITGGNTVSHEGRDYHIPKRDLVGVLVALFQSERLKIAEGLPDGPVLINELVNFRMKINLATGHDSYEAWRESVHDDLVLSVAMACWFGEHLPRPGSGTVASSPAIAPLSNPVFVNDRPPERPERLDTPDWTKW